MNWKQLIQKFGGGAKRRTEGREPGAVADSPGGDDSLEASPRDEKPIYVADFRVNRQGGVPSDQPRSAAKARSAKIRVWRRRVLQRRGAQMYASLVSSPTDSLAMLDDAGVVVSWHSRAADAERASAEIINRHVSQFYRPADISAKQQFRDLHAATLNGGDTRAGWRRRPDGVVFWGTAIITPLLLRDGRLQGFSYVTRREEVQPQGALDAACPTLR